MSTETQEKAKKNTQANASLMLGVISVVLALFNFFPGLLSALGVVGAVAALLAFLAGVRGLLQARTLEGQGRNFAIAGIATGAVGLLIYGAVLASEFLSAQRLVEQAEGTAAAGASPVTYQGGGFTLSYPAGWVDMADVFSQQDLCSQPGFNCVLAIAHPNRDGTNINLISFSLTEEATIDEVDQEAWTQIESSTTGVNLEARERVEVGGQPAVRRVFTTPSTTASGQQSYLVLVYVFNGNTVYQFTGFAPSADSWAQHHVEMEEIINSVEFSP